nr:MAG TPA: hypothetical protein [Caudoviricetes sp.]
MRQHPGGNRRRLHRCNLQVRLKGIPKKQAVSHTLVTDHTKTP